MSPDRSASRTGCPRRVTAPVRSPRSRRRGSVDASRCDPRVRHEVAVSPRSQRSRRLNVPVPLGRVHFDDLRAERVREPQQQLDPARARLRSPRSPLKSKPSPNVALAVPRNSTSAAIAVGEMTKATAKEPEPRQDAGRDQLRAGAASSRSCPGQPGEAGDAHPVRGRRREGPHGSAASRRRTRPGRPAPRRARTRQPRAYAPLAVAASSPTSPARHRGVEGLAPPARVIGGRGRADEDTEEVVGARIVGHPRTTPTCRAGRPPGGRCSRRSRATRRRPLRRGHRAAAARPLRRSRHRSR